MDDVSHVDELIESDHVVPTHLNTPDRVGWLTVRQLNMLLGPALFGSPAGWLLGQPLGVEVSAALAAIPLVMGGLLALPISPPVEHGLRKAAEYAWRKKAAGTIDARTLTGVRDVTADGVVRLTWKQECRAVWWLPSANLRLAHTLQKNAAVRRWASFLDGLTSPVQIAVRAKPVDLEPVLKRIAAGGSSEAARLASFLSAHTATSGLVQRERYLVVGANDEHHLTDRIRSVEDSLARAGLTPRRVQDEGVNKHVLHDLLQECWSPRALHESTIGPHLLQVRSQHVNADGELSRTVVLSAWPHAVGLDWLLPVLDGSLPIDVTLHIEPQDTERICARLDTKMRQYQSSAPSAARDTAIEDAETLRRALERRHAHAFSVGLYFLVRATTIEQLDERTRRLRQLVRELGGKTQVPRWEHRQGLASCVPTGEDRLRRRTLLDTSTVARTYPASNSTLVLDGGVPWGVTAHTPVVFTPFHSTLKNPHMAFYATSGAGKGYAAKVLQARLAQGQGVRVFGVDQDEDEEYTRLAEYLGGQVVRFGSSRVDLERIQLGGPCTIFNLANLPERQRGPPFAEIKQLVWSWVRRHGGPAAFVVDEAVSLLRDEQAANELEDLVRRGRHIQLGGVFITQRVADFINTTCGQVIQSIAASQWYGQQLPTELARVADVLRLSPAERAFLQGAGIGEGLLVAMGQRVAMSLWGHTSPEEYAMANTDPRRRRGDRREDSEYADAS